jgi:hypothetical protein
VRGKERERERERERENSSRTVQSSRTVSISTSLRIRCLNTVHVTTIRHNTRVYLPFVSNFRHGTDSAPADAQPAATQTQHTLSTHRPTACVAAEPLPAGGLGGYAALAGWARPQVAVRRLRSRRTTVRNTGRRAPVSHPVVVKIALGCNSSALIHDACVCAVLRCVHTLPFHPAR